MSGTTHASLRAHLVTERDRVSDQLVELGVDRDSFDEGFADSGQVTAERGEVDALVGTLARDADATSTTPSPSSTAAPTACASPVGDPISEARLEAMPAARLCITCASKRR